MNLRNHKYWLVTIPRRPHPIPFRIRSLSSSGPMVVIPQGIVRVGRCQPLFSPIAQTMGENKVAPKPHRNLSMLRRRRTKKNLTAARSELPFSFSPSHHRGGSCRCASRLLGHPSPRGVASPLIWSPGLAVAGCSAPPATSREIRDGSFF